MSRYVNAARYMGKMEEAINGLEDLKRFKATYGATGRPLDDLKKKYARDMETYGKLVIHLLRQK